MKGNNQHRSRIAYLEEVIKQLKEDAKRKDDDAKMRVKAFQDAIREDKKCKYDLSQKIAALQKENTKLLKMLGDASPAGSGRNGYCR